MFYDGVQEWVENGEKKNVVAFVRRNGDNAVFVAANLRPMDTSFVPQGVKLDPAQESILSENVKIDADGSVRFGPYGFVVHRISHSHKAQ